MKWYEDLFVGESVTGKIKKIKWKIEHNAGMLHTYIITFPSNEENLLDIKAGVSIHWRYLANKKRLEVEKPLPEEDWLKTAHWYYVL